VISRRPVPTALRSVPRSASSWYHHKCEIGHIIALRCLAERASTRCQEERRGEERNKIKIDLADIRRWCSVVFQRGVALATNGTPSRSRGDFQIRR